MSVAIVKMDRFVQGLIINVGKNDRAYTLWQSGARGKFNQAKQQWDKVRRDCAEGGH
jgi:hypothetical protein